jgi:hypothetical protein
MAGLDMKLLIVVLLLLGGTVHGRAQGERCGRSTLDPLASSGFDFIATCEQQNDEMLVLVTVRLRSAADMGGIVPKELRRLKLSFSGLLAGAGAAPGYQVVTDINGPTEALVSDVDTNRRRR